MSDFALDHWRKLGLLELCLELRMQANGSADWWGEHDEDRALLYLKERMEHWIAPQPSGQRFDDAVLELVKATIFEVESFIASRAGGE
jgi:hypothetical protein